MEKLIEGRDREVQTEKYEGNFTELSERMERVWGEGRKSYERN